VTRREWMAGDQKAIPAIDSQRCDAVHYRMTLSPLEVSGRQKDWCDRKIGKTEKRVLDCSVFTLLSIMFLPEIDHQETWRSIGRAVVNSHRRLDRALIIGNRCFGSLVSSLAAACSM